MFWNPLKKKPKKFLGIDIGTSAIKIVELSRQGDKIKLENYGEIASQVLSEKPFMTYERSSLLLSNQEIAKAIEAIFGVAKFDVREANFSIPDFSSFFTILELPPMSREEVPSAVQFAARQHIPIPLSEVVLDWLIVEGELANHKKTEGIKVVLVAVPHEVINQYQEIARLAQVRLVSLQAEVFGLLHALIKNKKSIVGVVDMGEQSTTISVAENGVLKTTHSFEVSGNGLTRTLSKSLNIGYNEAEELKRKVGLEIEEIQIKNILTEMIDLLVSEIEKISRDFYQTKGRELEKIILAGGSSLMPGLVDYCAKALKKPVEIANPFSEMIYPPNLNETIKEIGPGYAISVGMALTGLDR